MEVGVTYPTIFNVTCKQLIEICKKQGIKNYSNKKKALIIDLINKSNISTIYLNTRSHDKKITRNEVQAHGFKWESEIILKHFRIVPESITYCSKMDIPIELNTISYVNISIKTTCNPKVICMADALSLFKATIKRVPLHLIVIIYVQEDLIKRIKEIIEINLCDAHELLFGTISQEELSHLDSIIKTVPQKRTPSLEEHATMYALKDELQKKTYLQLNIKCNSQQSRLQCSFNKFQDFITKNTDRICYRSDDNCYYDVKLSATIESGPRKFKK